MMNQFNTSYTHGMFIEQKNTIKSLSNIWQHFSCLLDEGDCKMCNKFHSQKGFFRADQMGQKMTGRWAGLVAAQKVIVGIQFLALSTLIEIYQSTSYRH